jgi:hypothetical protein
LRCCKPRHRRRGCGNTPTREIRRSRRYRRQRPACSRGRLLESLEGDVSSVHGLRVPRVSGESRFVSVDEKRLRMQYPWKIRRDRDGHALPRPPLGKWVDANKWRLGDFDRLALAARCARDPRRQCQQSFKCDSRCCGSSAPRWPYSRRTRCAAPSPFSCLICRCGSSKVLRELSSCCV